MSQTIKLKRGTTTPTTSNIVSGEVAIDTSAKKLYINDAGTIKEIGGGLSSISVSDVPNLPASKITSGSFDAARIPSLPASRITSGTFAAARIPSLAASKITSGTFDAARIPSLAASKITSGTFDAARIPTLSQYLRSDADDTASGNLEFTGATTFKGSIGNSTTDVPSVRIGLSSGNDPQIQFTDSGYNSHIDFGASSGDDYDVRIIHSGANKLDFQGAGSTGIKIAGQTVFNDAYHPNADKWTTPRTITLSGDLSGSVSLDGSQNVTLSAQVSNDSHNHDGRYFTETEGDARYLRKDDGNFNWTRLGYGTSGTSYWHKLAEVTINGSYKDYQLRCQWTDRYNHGVLNIHIHSDNDTTADIWDAYVQQFGKTNRKPISHFKYYKSGSTVQVWIYTPSWREWDYYRTDAVTEGGPTVAWYKEGDSGAGKTTTEPSGLTAFTDYTPWHVNNDGASSGLDADLLDGQHGSHYLNYNNLTNKPSIPSTSQFVDLTSTQTNISGFKGFSQNVGVGSQIQHLSDSNTYLQFDTDRIRLVAGGTTKFDTSNDYVTTNTAQTITGVKTFAADVTVSGNRSANFYAFNGAYLKATTDARAPIFYDQDNTNWWVDPNSTGVSGKFAGNVEIHGDLKMNGTDSYIWTPNADNRYTGFWDSRNSVVAMSVNTNTAGNESVTFGGNGGTTASVWINTDNQNNYNNYNENIRLYNAGNSASVIAFGATAGTNGGTPATSILGYSDRFETRVGSTWRQRIYGGYIEVNGSIRPDLMYDRNNTGYYADPDGLSNLKDLRTGNDHHTNTPRWDTSFYVAQSQHYYGHSSSQVMYIGESGNPVRLRGTLNIGSNANVNSSMRLTVRGHADATDSYRAPIFYDTNNTARFIDPASTSQMLHINMNNGNLSGVNHITINDPGPTEGISWAGGNGWKIVESPDDLTTNSGGNFQFVQSSTRRMTIDTGGNLHVPSGSARAELFYDVQNTSYYVDPSSSSMLHRTNTNWLGVGVAPNSSGSYRLNMGGSIDMNANNIDYVSQLHFNDNVRFYDDGNDSYLNFKYGDTGPGGIKFRDGSNNLDGYVYADGGNIGFLGPDGSWALQCNNSVQYAYHQMRSPIFYDMNDTAYYFDGGADGSLKVKKRIDNQLGNLIDHDGTNNYIKGGAGGANWLHVEASNIQFNNNIRAPIFYDSNNTGYYVNPASTSNLNALNVGGNAVLTSVPNHSASLITSGTLSSARLPSIQRIDSANPTATNPPDNALEYFQTSGNTNLNPTGDWYNTIRLGHGDPVSYYGNTIAVKMTGTNVGDLYTRTLSNGNNQPWNRYWHSNNDGSGSGLDADLLDGQQGSYYLNYNNLTNKPTIPSTSNLVTTNTAQTISGAKTFTANVGVSGNISANFYAFNGSYVNATADVRAPIFYDRNNTSYYVHADSESVLNAVRGHHFRVSSGDGKGLRFWNSDSYKIYMSATSNSTHGGRAPYESTSDYNMYFRMNGGTNRGFVFRNNTTNVAGIDSSGNFNTSGIIKTGNGAASAPAYAFTADYDSGMFSLGSNAVGFATGGTQRFKINSNGLLLTGTSSLWVNGQQTITNTRDIANVVNYQNTDGHMQLHRTAAAPLIINRKGTTGSTGSSRGEICNFKSANTKVGRIGYAQPYGGNFYFATGDWALGLYTFSSSRFVQPSDHTGAVRDNQVDLGSTSARFDDVYATNGTIQTSDRNEKQDIQELTDAETRAAVTCKGLMRRFRWVDSVAEKGDDARYHFGAIAQDVEAAFTAEGLDAGDYGLFIRTTWWEHEGDWYPEADVAPEGAVEKTRLGIRYNQLFAFIIGAL